MEGRKEVCHAAGQPELACKVKSSALVTDFVLAEGTHQTRCLFRKDFSGMGVESYMNLDLVS